MAKARAAAARQEGPEDRLARDVSAWRDQVDTGARHTDSMIPVNPLYTPLDLTHWDYCDALGTPGAYPFTRGPYPSMYPGRPWTIRQYAGFGNAEESNRRYRSLLAQGTTGLSVAFDLPSQMGYDSDHPLADGEVGKVGVAIDSLADFERLFDGIPLDQVTTSMTINAPAAIMLVMYVALAKKRGTDPRRLSGTVQNDILKEYLARGTYIFPPEPSLRLTVDIFQFACEHVPRWNTISISGYHIREAGSDAVQEVAFTLANAVTYVNAAIQRGLAVDAFAPRLSFFFNAHMNLFEEVAKYRAARRLWATIMRDRFRARHPRSWTLRFHTQTAGCALTAQQPELNVIRVTLQALAAVMGGTQSLHTNAWDEALSLPSEQSARVALRTQQILAHETGVADVIDPLGGSYFIEYLTDELQSRAEEYMERIDAMGGSLAAIGNGFMKREIEETAYRYQKEIEQSARVIVGVNRFTEGDPSGQGALEADPALQDNQIAALREVRRRRDGREVRDALAEVARAARGDANLMPPLIRAVEAYATVGEICHTLRDCWGEYKEPGGSML